MSCKCRIGELASAFDPKSSLLCSDVRISDDVIRLWVRSPKVSSPTGDILEVFQVPDSSLDPIAAVKYYMSFRRKVDHGTADLPFFIEEDGRVFTKQKFNRLLHELIDLFLNSDRDSLTCHSFRGGLATLMESAEFSSAVISIFCTNISQKIIC